MFEPSLTMIRTIQFSLLALVIIAVFGGCSSNRIPRDGHTREQQRQIAEACFALLHSSLTNEMDIPVDDPRLPAAIRELHPIEITAQGTDVVIMRNGRPSEYHLSRRTSDAKPWVLYVAGEGYQGHQELIRLGHE